MQAIIIEMYGPQSARWATKRKSLWRNFIGWCEHQQKQRLLWLVVSVAAHGCFLTPLTLLTVMISGAGMLALAIVIGAIGTVVVTNLAALPTKITIPILTFSIVIDLAIIASCILAGAV